MKIDQQLLLFCCVHCKVELLTLTLTFIQQQGVTVYVLVF